MACPPSVLISMLALCLSCFGVVPAAAAAPVQAGDVAPPFTLDDLAGSPMTLGESLASGPTVVVFFRTDCSHCKVEMPLLQRLSREESYASLRFLAVNVREKAAAIMPFVEEHGIEFPVTLDAKMTVTRAYGVPSIPRLYFVRRDGTVASTIGSASEEVIREHLDGLLHAGGPVAQKILLIMPDQNLESGQLTVAAAEQAGYEPIVWDMAQQGVIDEESLRRHLLRPIVRLIPDDTPAAAIGRAEETALLGVLSDGGKLLFVGNDVAKSAHRTDIFQYYVTTKYEADDAGSRRVLGVAGDPVFAGLDFALREKTPDHGLVEPDLIAPSGSDAIPVLNYGDERAGCAALLVKT